MTTRDRELIRDLARRIAEIAADPGQEERRQVWYTQNALQPVRPPIFISPEGSWSELLTPAALQCEDDDARGLEHGLRMKLYAWEHFADDQVLDDEFRVPYAVTNTDWGIAVPTHYSDAPRGAYVWDTAIRTRADIDRIQTPTATHDPAETERRLAYYQDLFGDLLQVKLHGRWWWSTGLIDEWTRLRGITQTFWDMTDDPEFVHAGMQRLLEGKLAWLESLEAQGLNTLNNGNDYVGSGGFGFSTELPQPDFTGAVRLQDMWGFCEAQTMSEVSPAMHEEFVLRYQLPLLARFGLNCYGCCEPLHRKLPMLKQQVPNMRRVSISPWADKRLSAQELGGDCVFSWKPNPAALAGVEFDPEWVRQDIRETLAIGQEYGCCVEIILKDTHTCNQRPERFDQWGKIAREEVERSLA